MQHDEPTVFHRLDDPAFLAEWARIRTELQHVPEKAVERAALEGVYKAMTVEFDRRARQTWTKVS
jgi:hypothetical protein